MPPPATAQPMPPLTGVAAAGAVAAREPREGNSAFDTTTKLKCAFRSCPVRQPGPQMVACGANKCDKKVHLMCYQMLLLEKHNVAALSDGKVACTKKCYEKISKVGDKDDDDTRKGNWDSDGKQGPQDPHTSMKILLDWWLEEGNYSKYRGKNNDGLKKSQFCEMLALKMTNETSTTRTAKNVKSKIEHIERSFKKAHNFATSETGAGIKDSDEGRFEDLVRKECSVYYDILDVMQDRASCKPKATNYEDFTVDDEIEMLECTGNTNDANDACSEMSGDDDDRAGLSVAGVSVANASTDGVSVAASSASKRPASAIKATASRSGKKQRTAKKSPPSTLLDDELSMAMAESTRVAGNRFSEMQRHNQVLEDIERGRYDLERKRDEREARRLELEQTRMESLQWKQKSEQLDYQIKLVNKYHEIKLKYNWSDDQILRHFPSMKSVIENMNVTEGDLE